ncbi:hypothetical protein BaRGS_00027365 [Batillaria attramentaria]|uniref:TIR domain-containing protein n=1 Tax=Batillaria attramentaria TaxID=370345 RepID=A0ABD0K333_9CAEN
MSTFSDTEFGSAFEGLVNIKTLHFGDHCKLKYFQNTTLTAFKNSSLEEIYVNAKHMITIEICAFCGFPHLKPCTDFSSSLLLRDREERPGSIRAENIVEHIDDSWKVLLLVTRDFAMDEWACGFTVQQAQRSITDTMPDRVIVVFMEDPARLPPMASLERLLRMVPERNVMYVHRDTPPHDPQWDRLARAILGENTSRD